MVTAVEMTLCIRSQKHAAMCWLCMASYISQVCLGIVVEHIAGDGSILWQADEVIESMEPRSQYGDGDGFFIGAAMAVIHCISESILA